MYWLIPIQNWWQNWCGWCIRDSIPHFKHFYKANFYWLLLEVTLCEMYSLIIISLGNYNNLECSVEATEIQGGTYLQLELFTLITFDPCVAHELVIWNDSHDLQWQEEILHWSQNNTRFFHFRIFNPVYLVFWIKMSHTLSVFCIVWTYLWSLMPTQPLHQITTVTQKCDKLHQFFLSSREAKVSIFI